jgi:hypothetical protein
MLTRTFAIEFADDADAQEIKAELSLTSCFEQVILNRVLAKEYSALHRWVPHSSTAFDEQWYMDDANDKFDIDMPEAWAITRGEPSVVIVIHDSGTAVDTCFNASDCSTPIDWRINRDFYYLWNYAEDTRGPGVLNRYDVRGTDGDSDGAFDNIIGANFAPGYSGGSVYENDFWRAMPNDLWMQSANEQLTSWNCWGYKDHGTKVGSIACARDTNVVSGGDVVGVANKCRVYWVRAGLYAVTNVQDEADAILHAAAKGDVINMSWGFAKPVFGTTDPGPPLSTAIECAADDFDCVLIAAVGNKKYTDFVPFPAQYDRVLAVGALEKLDGTLVHKSNAQSLGNDTGYSNYDENNLIVDVVGPVHDGIWADLHEPEDCDPNPCPCASSISAGKTPFGTSFAAPQAAGIAALIRSRFGNMKQDSVRARIKRAAEYYSEWTSDSKGPYKYGAGKVNAYRSITEWGKVATNNSHVAEWGGQRSGWPDTLYISGDLFVEPGDTLVLNRGTVIRVAPEPIAHAEGTGSDPNRVEIVVRGTLRMGATGTGPVIFESFTPGTPTSSDWAGIRFESGSRGVLRNVIIKNASQDVVVDEFGITVADWDTKRKLYLNTGLSVTSDLTIPSTDSLFVLGASQVTVTGGTGVDIFVDGSLICKGSATKRPEFRSSTEASSSWGGIRLQSGSENHQFYHCTIRDAQLAIRNHVPLTVDRCTIKEGTDGLQAHADLTVKHTRIHDHIGAGIAVYAGSLIASNDTIFDCAYGIHQSTATSTGPVTITRSHLHDFDYRGINVPSASGGVSITRSLIENAYEGVVLAAQTSALIDSCVVRNGNLGVFFYGDPSATIRQSKITGNASTGVYLVASSATLQADTVSSSAAGLFFQFNSAGLVEQVCRITNNGVGIKCDSTASPTIRSTRISGNTDGVVALRGSNPDLGHASGATCDTGLNEGRNSIHANSGYDVINSSASLTLSAECDWWDGVPSASKFSGSVDYTPYRTADPNPLGSIEDIPPPPPPEPEPVLPTRYELIGSRPNPFNPTATVYFDVPPPGGDIVIAVFDVTGAPVRSLVNGRHAPGRHATVWDGRDDRGEPIASGVYFLRMTAGSFMQTRKVVLLK